MSIPRLHTPLLSVITVVYNNARDIERTIQSVIEQSYYPYIEYIIIDGASTDGTLAILDKYKPQIHTLVSEKDSGIYDAMNKGLRMATGKYVLFMNSGDEIYEKDTVEKVFATYPDADIYYGETEMIDDNGHSLGRRRHKSPDKFDWKSFKYGMNISHQAIYIKRSITTPYDRRYTLSADIDWIIKAAKKAQTIINTHRYVAKYLVGGMSKKRHWQSLKERFTIFCRHYGFLPTILNHVIIAFNLLGYYIKHGRTND
ncbi:glycosyltransferase family 2 protein [Olivibacter sitiensis]|uniref:glycosyltransferase family 2 protein n=1 Tax=Olivibacter sitiensis TaxID=376470 RepID=UPI00056B9D92|nr:glycosyltransferase family 2 protein [Olivibacter sitiensis]